LGHLIGGTPAATTFRCAPCMLLYDVIQVVRATAAAAHARAVEEVSTEKLFYDAQRELVSLTTLGDVGQVAGAFDRATTAEEVRGRLAELLGGVWSERRLKAPAKKRPPPRSRAKQSGAHTSVFRVLKASRDSGSRPRGSTS